MVSVDHMPVSLLVWNTVSAFYCLARGITAEGGSICVVLAIVYLSCSRSICHRSLSSSGDTVEWRPFDWNVFACGISCTVAFVSDTFLDGIEATLTLTIIQLVMAPMSYIWSTELLSLSVLMSSWDPPYLMTASMFLYISSFIVRELLGNRTFCWSHSCANKQVEFKHICISLSAGVLVVTPSIVPLEDNGRINLWSSVAMKIGTLQKGCLRISSHLHAIGWGSPGCDPWFHSTRSLCWVSISWYPLSKDCCMLWLPELLALPLWYCARQCMARRHICCL